MTTHPPAGHEDPQRRDLPDLWNQAHSEQREVLKKLPRLTERLAELDHAWDQLDKTRRDGLPDPQQLSEVDYRLHEAWEEAIPLLSALVSSSRAGWAERRLLDDAAPKGPLRWPASEGIGRALLRLQLEAQRYTTCYPSGLAPQIHEVYVWIGDDSEPWGVGSTTSAALAYGLLNCQAQCEAASPPEPMADPVWFAQRGTWVYLLSPRMDLVAEWMDLEGVTSNDVLQAGSEGAGAPASSE